MHTKSVGGLAFAALALVGTGSLLFTGTGAVEFTAELVGVGELSDTAVWLKHFEEFSNVDRFLNLTLPAGTAATSRGGSSASALQPSAGPFCRPRSASAATPLHPR